MRFFTIREAERLGAFLGSFLLLSLAFLFFVDLLVVLDRFEVPFWSICVAQIDQRTHLCVCL